uniref:Uncharacterized protein n=2 Tax=viral metagenome TaxID=1070528 RepID=A0A6H1ZWJ1_9ZZZZ
MIQIHDERLIRKAKRVAYQARYARLIKTFNHPSGRTMQVFTADRSHGYKTDYKRVETYYLLIYENGALIHGVTMSKGEWQKQESEFAELCSC